MPGPRELLERVSADLKDPLASTMRLQDFLARPPELSKAERIAIVSQALWMLESSYVHLPQKRAMYAIDPLQQLRLMRHRLEQTPDAELAHDLDFHREMTRLFTALRDLHTNYLLPQPYRDAVAFLPFFVEEYYDANEPTPRYLVSKVLVAGDDVPAVGSEIITWNGMPIARAIALLGDAQAGSNAAARYASGLDALTIRPLMRSLPPDEYWVVVGTHRGRRQVETRVDWLVYTPPPIPQIVPMSSTSGAALALGYDIQTVAIQETRKTFFAQPAVAAERRAAQEGVPQAVPDSLETHMPTVFRARPQTTPSGIFAYIRLFTFMVNSAAAFVEEFARLAGNLPQEGLILDVRGNGGGLVLAAEQLLQLLTPHLIEPENFQFVNSPITAALTRVFDDLGAWQSSIRQATETGALHSLGFPITDPGDANAFGQVYTGPVVLITDARCYSATDIFAAGFRDHAIGAILGTDTNTGAGGANVWRYSDLQKLAQVATRQAVPTLPAGADLRVAVRRSLRVGANAGVVLEDLGIVPDAVHRMTKNDLLHGNNDLLAAAGALLAEMNSANPPASLTVVVDSIRKRRVRVQIHALGISQIGIFVDRRPVLVRPIADQPVSLSVQVPKNQSGMIEVSGWSSDGVLRARRRVVQLI